MKMSDTGNKEVFVLPSWYPSKLQPHGGDFVQRHIAAIATFQKQYVLHVIKDPEGRLTRDVKSELLQKENFREEIIYYHPLRTGFGIIDKIISDRKYYKVYKKAVRAYLAANGRPLLTHVHLAMKAGPVALWMKKVFKIPYLLTEHWTGYLPEADLQLKDHNRIFVERTREVMENAEAVTVVSRHLGNAIRSLFPTTECTVIPNVVDTRLFHPGNRAKNLVPQFVHASTFTFQKNLADILRAFEIVKEKNLRFVLQLFGPADLQLKREVERSGLADFVVFRGEVPQEKLALEMQAADALILYSRFETFGCVIIEANAAGIPVIVSDIPVFHELVREAENGFYVPGEDPQKLAERLADFINKRIGPDLSKLAKNTEQYSYQKVGKRFAELYQHLAPR